MTKRLELQRQPERESRCVIPTVPEVAVTFNYEHITLMVPKNSVLRKLFGSKEEEIAGA
jgi:hypothetical protein